MLRLKALVTCAVALTYSDGRGGIGLVGAADLASAMDKEEIGTARLQDLVDGVPTLEEDRETTLGSPGVSSTGGKAELHLPEDVDIATAMDVHDRAGKFNVLGTLKNLVGALGAQNPLVVADTEEERAAMKLRAAAPEDGSANSHTHPENKHEDSRTEKEKFIDFHTPRMMEKLQSDFDKSGIPGEPQDHLPAEEKVRYIYSGMYDSYQAENGTDYVPTTGDVISFMHNRTMSDPETSTYQEVMTCTKFFTNTLILDDYKNMNLTESDINAVATAPIYDEEIQDLLMGHGYHLETFQQGFYHIFPLRFDFLPEEATKDVEILCSFLVEEVFVPAGESACQHRMEEIILTNAKAMDKETPFPDIVDTPTFGDTIQLVCERHFPEELLNTTQEDYDTFVDEKCSEMLANITAVEIDEDKSIVQYTSEICDALGLELPHPNITISLRHASPHMLNHKPGGPHLRMRHVMTDIFHYAGHYKHGFMDEYGNYIEHSNGDVLLSIGEEDNSSFFSQPADGASKPSLDRNRKNLYCSGAGFSVGFGVEVGAGPLSAGGGLDYGFGRAGTEKQPAKQYEESFFYGVCGNMASFERDYSPKDPPKSKSAAKSASQNLGISFSATAGFYHSVGALPGFALVKEVSFQHWIFTGSVAVVMTASGTNDDGSVSADVTTWWTKPAFGGMTLSFGISLSPGKTISINDSRCFGETIKSTDWKWDTSPSECADKTFSFDFKITNNSYQKTTLYYYKTRADYDARSITLIETFCNGVSDKNHFSAKEFYAVGIVAQSGDALEVKDVTVMEHMGGFDWQTRLQEDGSWCLSLDDPGCYDVVEWRRDGKDRNDNPGVYKGPGYSSWQNKGTFYVEVRTDITVDAGNWREASSNKYDYYHQSYDGNSNFKWKTYKGDWIWEDYFTTSEPKAIRVVSHTTKNTDAFVLDWIYMVVKDKRGNKCKSKVQIGGDNTVGYCMNRQSSIDIAKKHCYLGKACTQYEFGLDGGWSYPPDAKCYSLSEGIRGSLSLDNSPEDEENSESCVDTPNWSLGEIDSMGDEMNCEWFGKNSGTCDIYGELNTGFGTANLNCCTCQG